ncbi:RNA polymerase sigma-70 factor, ECF subfamily [Salinibacillus kushneri]|uniref:RNA polymerase sigma-70 factor, ECF subfamily n=1 Tax=Salinibacillus kushneri TaxID=237682 RepID=A0A1I0ERX1_9BACI|nr:RNA polymerase sigma factor [Salinibacillus kushneri]SET48159.1 RNA polymerase sigma-70 factor, ECF subfamily [Salinibacillus kushneri]
MTNEDVVTTWFHQYSDDVYNFLIYYVGSGDVEDMVQEVFIKAMKHFKHESKPKTWLFSIARNVAIDQMRKKKRERNKESKLLQEKNMSNEESPEDIYQLSETKRELYQAVQCLKKNYREVLLLRGIQELTIEETARILGWSPNKVKVTFHRAMKTLKKQMGGVK